MIEIKINSEIKKKKTVKKIIIFCIFLCVLSVFTLTVVSASLPSPDTSEVTELSSTEPNSSSASSPSISLDLGEAGSPSGIADSVNILLFLTVIALAPSILVLMTGFTRILIVLSFVRNALGLQQTPPNQVLVGLSLFLTVFLMSPIFVRINDEALQPYINETITQEEAVTSALRPLREFMMAQTSPEDMKTFLSITNEPMPENYDDIKTEVLIPAFVLNEIKRAFIIGFFIYVPFLIIDLVVASTLMSLGMMMLPPAMVSMPFKLILFMIVDGWGLIMTTLMSSFN